MHAIGGSLTGYTRLGLVVLGTLALLAGATAAPALAPNDECSNAAHIAGNDYPLYVDLTMGTDGVGDPVHSCTGSADHHTLWYYYTAPSTGDATATTTPFGVPIYAVLTVYDGSCGALTELDCSANGMGLNPVQFPVVADQTYLIGVSAGTTAGWVGLIVLNPPGCGDGSVNQPGEECDDGNGVDEDACTNACLNAECGDGIYYADEEECDDGNAVPGDGCDACQATCGDGFIVGKEDCDDGNVLDGDGCESDCRFPCPHSLCKCLGAAGGFAAVGGASLQLKTGVLSAEGESEYVPSEVYGSLCAVKAKFSAKESENYIEGDLVCSEPSRVAVKFSPIRFEGDVEPGTSIAGEVATGGGSVKKPEAADFEGVPSTDGTHPKVALCQQAPADVAAASTTLKNLTPTVTMAEIVVADGDVQTLAVGPGVQVINVNALKILSGRDEDGFPVPSELTIALDPGTDAVVINIAEDLTVEADSGIIIDGAEDAVILNVHGDRPHVKIKDGAYVLPVLLAPSASLKAPAYSYFTNIYTAKKLQVKGGTLEDALLCE